MKKISFYILSLATLTGFAQNNAAKQIHSVQSLSSDIKLSFIASWATDTMRISFLPGATTAFDSGLDILKPVPSNTYDPSISSICITQDLSRNALPTSQQITIPIRVTVGVTGKYILTMDSNSIMLSNACMMLEDLAISYFQDMKANPSYSFVLNDTTTAPRFLLHIGQTAAKTAISPKCSYTQNGMGIVTASGNGIWDCTWFDGIGNVLASNTNITGADSLKNLAPGVYPITISGNSGYCNTTYNDTLIIDPATPISVNAIITNVNCPGATTGMINANMVLGGQAPYTYAWSNSSTSSTIQNLSAGVYILTLCDAYGCKDTSMYAVQQLSNLFVGFNISADTLTMANPTITFTNQTTGQTNLSWNFGDASPFSNAYNPSHTYGSGGTYTVELTANDAFCVTKKQKTVVVLSPTGIDNQALNDQITIYSNNGNAIIKFNLQDSKDALINVYSIEGKLINTMNSTAYANTETVKLSEASGIYLVEVMIENTKMVKKVIN